MLSVGAAIASLGAAIAGIASVAQSKLMLVVTRQHESLSDRGYKNCFVGVVSIIQIFLTLTRLKAV